MSSRNLKRFGLAVLAGVTSLLVLILLHGEGASTEVLLLVVASGTLWCLALRLSGRPLATPADSPKLPRFSTAETVLPTPVAADALGRFYLHLLGSLEQTWQAFHKHYRHTEKSLLNVELALNRAIELTRNTSLLAANAMTASASSGEIGRGFVTVSQDLIDISERSGGDIQRLRQLVANLSHELTRLGSLVEHPPEFWVVSSAGLPLQDLVNLRAGLAHCQHELRVLAERYRRSPQQDVRWLQLGDAIKRLLNELINTLFQLELHLDDVLSDMRLLRLGESPGSGQQIVEIKDRLQASLEPGGLSQKFIQ